LLSLGHTFLIFFYGWLVFGAAVGFRGVIGDVLMRPELRFLGKISYGLYVFHHFFTFVSFRGFLENVGFPTGIADNIFAQSLVRLIMTILLAVTSWYLYENPLNNLKRHFSLRRKLREASTAQGVGATVSQDC
jgi:peptidoglycan/LPS O-acetylase OafA/YrhL